MTKFSTLAAGTLLGLAALTSVASADGLAGSRNAFKAQEETSRADVAQGRHQTRDAAPLGYTSGQDRSNARFEGVRVRNTPAPATRGSKALPEERVLVPGTQF
ncbi:hypothetical protein [Mangrovicella endophytica]|uniref:hypothetical protein n=1 Tax=Mangrovicella endophytica TaxID=2066697 RepID=UPI000C9E672B|nr:hypothetical protein [Mangrovicella endophytica]